jgi:hypothetical protein
MSDGVDARAVVLDVVFVVVVSDVVVAGVAVEAIV